jgi:hypothetical protein
LGCVFKIQPPARALSGLDLVDDGDQFEVGNAERQDPVGRAPAWVTPALDRSGRAAPRVGANNPILPANEHDLGM